MPNHCENDLYITGTEDDVRVVLAHIGMFRDAPELDFNTIIPYPEKYAAMDSEYESIPNLVGLCRGTPQYDTRLAERKTAFEAYQVKWGTNKDGFNSGGIEWCHREWGTKWGAYHVVRRDYRGKVCITFQTAWSPAPKVIQALAKMFSRCNYTLEYFERGMGFAGGFEILSEEDWYEDTPWEPGTIIGAWSTQEYKGIRGG